jgi:guanylate kinase
VSYTTRPPRDEEVEGEDYFFISKENFQDMEAQDLWYEFVEFNGWFYGTTKEQFYGGCNVFIMTPKGLSHLSEKDRNESLVIYFNVDEITRRTRMNQRKGNADSVERRLEADVIDFKDFKNFDIEISEKYYTKEDLLNIITDYIKPITYV